MSPSFDHRTYHLLILVRQPRTQCLYFCIGATSTPQIFILVTCPVYNIFNLKIKKPCTDFDTIQDQIQLDFSQQPIYYNRCILTLTFMYGENVKAYIRLFASVVVPV